MNFAQHPASSPYQQNLDKNPANYAPLTPLSFLERAADVFPERTAVIHGDWRCDYRELRARSRRLASALAKRGVQPGDTVAVMAPNIPAVLEAHHGVPMAGAVLNALNTRLEADTIAYILDHGQAKVLLTDTEYSPVIEDALERASVQPAGGGHRRSRLRAGAASASETDLRRAAGGGRSRLRAALSGRRVAGDLAQLHLGHHGAAEGRRLPPPRRLSERDRRHPGLGHGAAPGLSLDPTHVPLQWLVLSLGRLPAGGNPRLPAQGRSRRDL